MRKSMCAPCLDLAGDILYKSGKWLTKPFNVCMDFFSSFDNFKLYFCGFSLVLGSVQRFRLSSLFAFQSVSQLAATVKQSE